MGNLTPTKIRSPDRPARSKSLCRLKYTGPQVSVYYGINRYNSYVPADTKISNLQVPILCRKRKKSTYRCTKVAEERKEKDRKRRIWKYACLLRHIWCSCYTIQTVERKYLYVKGALQFILKHGNIQRRHFQVEFHCAYVRKQMNVCQLLNKIINYQWF